MSAYRAEARRLEMGQVPEHYGYEQSFFDGDSTPLSPETGYILILGLGAFLSILAAAVVHLDRGVNNIEQTSEYFLTAGRTVKTGLTAAVIVAHWTWVSSLSVSAGVAWKYGVSVPLWYASGATIQVVLFSILAVSVKRRAPSAHTVCEMVLARWGHLAHITFIFFCLLANVIVTSMLLLGAAATVKVVTGMDSDRALVLLPLGFIFYTAWGGLKATYCASYIQVVVIFILLLVFVGTVYIREYSMDLIYDGLQKVAGDSVEECKHLFSSLAAGGTFFRPGRYACGKVSGNKDGSYLTMHSMDGLKFGITNIVGNCGTLFVDQSYWQHAIAARPASAHRGFLFAGIAWFAIPFAMATCLGLAAVAVRLPLSAEEADRGLVPPAMAAHTLGSAGSAMILIMELMAVTSSGSAESIAVSSLVTHDIYKTYVDRSADGRRLLMVSRATVVAFGFLMTLVCVGLDHWGTVLYHVQTAMGTLIGSAIVPLCLMLQWRDANAEGAIAGAWGGMFLGIVAWAVTAKVQSGLVTLDPLSTQGSLSNLAGSLVAICASAIIHVAFSVIKPQHYDFRSMGAIKVLEGDQPSPDAKEKSFPEEHAEAETRILGWGFTAVVLLLWPLLSLPAGVFSKSYWKLWVTISIAWTLIAACWLIWLPLYESRGSAADFYFYVTGRQKTARSEEAASRAVQC